MEKVPYPVVAQCFQAPNRTGEAVEAVLIHRFGTSFGFPRSRIDVLTIRRRDTDILAQAKTSYRLEVRV